MSIREKKRMYQTKGELSRQPQMQLLKTSSPHIFVAAAATVVKYSYNATDVQDDLQRIIIIT